MMFRTHNGSKISGMTTLAALVPSQEHVHPGHPEAPSRLAEVRIAQRGVTWLDAPPAQPDEIARVHTPAMIESVRQACREPGIIDYAPTYVTSTSYRDALKAAGAALALTRAVTDGAAHNAFAIARPPGHHAEPGRAMGFGLFNNVAVAAQDALTRGLERVLIVDFDAHHGNGTQAYAWNNPAVAYFSCHQEYIYPGSGAIEDAPHARQRIVNAPLPQHSGDQAFAALTRDLITPLARHFRPQLMLVSAGFDAHWRDPLTTLGVTTAGFYAISRRLVELAGELCRGKIVFVLEGGYDPRSLSRGVDAVFAALTGSGSGMDTESLSPYREPDVSARLNAVRAYHNL